MLRGSWALVRGGIRVVTINRGLGVRIGRVMEGAMGLARMIMMSTELVSVCSMIEHGDTALLIWVLGPLGGKLLGDSLRCLLDGKEGMDTEAIPICFACLVTL